LFRSDSTAKFYVIETQPLEVYCERYLGIELEQFRIRSPEEINQTGFDL